MTKWCRCCDPILSHKYGDNGIYCDHCGREYHKWKNIRGTQLIDYPIGTVFAILNANYPVWVRAVRYRDVLVLESNNEYPQGEWKLVIHEGSMLLQDRFEIVEDSE